MVLGSSSVLPQCLQVASGFLSVRQAVVYFRGLKHLSVLCLLTCVPTTNITLDDILFQIRN